MSWRGHDGVRPALRRGRRESGHTMVDLVIVMVLAAIFLGLAYSTWQRHAAREQLQSGVSQVASSLREAEERAKAERTVYTVTFTASSPMYTIERHGGGYVEKAELPRSVTSTASAIVTFSAFGQPDAAYNLTFQSAAGTRTTYIGASGDIVYQAR